jgi:signal peptidase
MKDFLRKHGGFVLTLMLIAGWAVLLRPAGLLAGPADYIIVSGESMEPTYYSGDLIVTRATDTYAVGDVITYRIPEGEPGEGTAIIHRIVDGTPSGYVTQGDNREGVDPWNPAIPDVVGKTWIRIPEAGNILLFLLQPPIVAALAGGLTTLLLLLRREPRMRVPQPA